MCQYPFKGAPLQTDLSGKPDEISAPGFRDRLYSFLFRKGQIDFLQMLGLTCLLATVSLWQIRGFGRLSMLCYICAVMSLCGASFFAGGGYRSEASSRLWNNTLFLFVLEGLSLIYLAVNRTDVTKAIGARLAFFLMAGLALCLLFQLFQMFFTARRKKLERASMLEIGLLTALCVIFGLLLNLECFNTWPRWDSFQYYHGIDKLSAGNIFMPGANGLRVCGHISTAYVLFSFFFQMLPGISHLNALYLSNMFLVAADLVLAYKIFKKLLPQAKLPVHLLYSVIVICMSSVFGSVATLDAERLLMTGMLLLLYAALYENGLMGIFAAFVLCQSRETGPLAAAAVIMTQFIFSLIERIKYGKEKKIRWDYYFLCFVTGIMWVWRYLKGNWSADIAQKHTMLDTDYFNKFGFSALHIKDVAEAGFVAHFRWLLTLLVILGAVMFLTRTVQTRRRGKHVTMSVSASSAGIWMAIAGFTAFILETAFYVTYTFDRYFTLSSALLCILGLCSLYYLMVTLWSKRTVHFAVAILLGGAFLAHSYVTIDPVTVKMYNTLDTGNALLAESPQHVSGYIEDNFAVATVFNRQIMYFDKALDRAYAAIYEEGNSENTKVFCSNEYLVQPPAVRSDLIIWGNGYAYRDPPMWGKWNSERQYRYLSYSEDPTTEPVYVMHDTDLGQYLDEYEHMYYIEMPWGDTVLDALQERYPISFDQTIKYHGWVLNLYKIK